jgi:hypothetical protein
MRVFVYFDAGAIRLRNSGANAASAFANPVIEMGEKRLTRSKTGHCDHQRDETHN